MAASAGREEEAVEPVDRPQDRVPVGRHVVQADAAAHAAHSGQVRKPPGHALVNVLLELGVDVLVERLGIGVLVLLRESPPDEQVRLAVLGRGAHVDAVDLRGDRAREGELGGGLEDDVLLAGDLERQLEADVRGQLQRPGPRRQDEAVALDELSRDSHAPDPIALDHDTLDRRALERAAFEALESLHVGVRGCDGIGEPGVRLVERQADAGLLGSGQELLEVEHLEGVEPLPVLHLGVLERNCRALLVDEEQPAAPRVDRVALEQERQPAERLTRAERHPDDLRVRVVAADDRRRLARRLLAEAACLQEQDVEASTRELAGGRRAEDPAPDDDRGGALHRAIRSRTGSR